MERDRTSDHAVEANRPLNFSVLAYAGAVLVGTCGYGAIMAVLLVAQHSHGAEQALATAVLKLGLAVGLAGFFPALLLFLPSVLFSHWLFNRFGWRSAPLFAVAGALCALASATLIGITFSFVAQSFWGESAGFLPNFRDTLTSPLIPLFPLAGALAGISYRWLHDLSSPNTHDQESISRGHHNS